MAAISIYNTIISLIHLSRVLFKVSFCIGFYPYFLAHWAYYRLRALWIIHNTPGLHIVEKSDGAFAQMPNVMDNVVFMLSSTPDVQTVRKDLWDTVVTARDEKGHFKFPKFSWVLETHHDISFWKEAVVVQPERHVFLLEGKTPNSEDDLKSALCQLYDEPLPHDLPRWQFIFIPLGSYFVHSATGCCFVIRMQHAMADGVSLFRLLSEVIADNPHPLTVNTVQRFLKDGEPIGDKCWALLEALGDWPFVSFGHMKKNWSNLLHGPELSGSPRTTWQNFDLSYVKSISKATNATVNDICLSCLAGAFRSYFEMKKAKLPSNLLSMNSITAHKVKIGDPLVLTNLVATGVMDMAIHEQDPIDRLQATKIEANKLKVSPFVFFDFIVFQNLFPYVPPKKRIEKFNICNAVTVITTNVAGPQHQMQLFGQNVCNIMPIHILLDRIGMSVVFMGYNNTLVVNFCVDKVLMNQEEVETFKDLFVQEMEILNNSSLIDTVN